MNNNTIALSNYNFHLFIILGLKQSLPVNEYFSSSQCHINFLISKQAPESKCGESLLCR